MYIIGIDFSIKFPSACITNDFKNFKFISLVNTNNISIIHKKFLIDAQKALPDFNIKFSEGVPKKEEYYITERNKLLNYSLLSKNMVNLIKEHIGTIDSNDIPLLAIEGTSFNSKGSYAFELPAASMLFKNNMYENVLLKNINNYFVFPPANLKQAIGCKGNAKKDIIFKQFLDDPGIDAIKDTKFYKFLKLNKDNPRVFNNKTGLVASPWNDLIDAYLAVLKLYNITFKK